MTSLTVCSVCNQFKLIPILSQIASVMDRDQIAEAVMVKENVLANLISLAKHAIDASLSTLTFHVVRVSRRTVQCFGTRILFNRPSFI